MEKPVPQQIADLIERLNGAVSADEARDGWTERSKSAIAAYFQARLCELEQGNMEEDRGLVRGLDAWGVGGGHLHSDALRLNRLLR